MSPEPRSAARRSSRILIALFAILAVMFSGLSVPLAAQAAESALTIDKKVDDLDLQDQLAPGDEFTYTIDLACFDVDCVNVVLTDTLPAEFAGFAFVDASYSPATLPLTVSTEGCVEENGLPVEVTADCTFTTVFQQPIDGGAVGLEAGGTLKLSLVLRAPLDLSADWAFNGQTVTNTAEAAWDNGPGDAPATISDDADAVVTVDTVVDVEASKSWSPASQQFEPGESSTITLGAQSLSNVSAETLVIQEPIGAVDGATDLGADNPFRIVDFAGFGAATMPADATTVQVDVYVFDEGTGTWGWVTGTPAAEPGLGGIDPADVGGIRMTYAGGPIAPDAAVSVAFDVVQRESDRDDDSSLATGDGLTNTVGATLTAPGQDPVTDDAEAPYEIGPLTVSVSAEKTITPAELAAGGEASAVLGATNTSNGPVQSLTISDRDFFDADMEFGGFTGAIAYPTGATAATITWYVDGEDPIGVPFDSGMTPLPPAGVVTGFAIEFTGDIPAEASVSLGVGILPGLGLVSEDERTHSATNTIETSATNVVGTATDEDDADITVYYPEIGISLEKRITPGGAVEPGNSVVANLTATTATGVAQVDQTRIVVEDSRREGQGDDFWNAFDATAIAPTQVPPNSTLTVEYQRPDGSWATLTSQTAGATAGILQLSRAEFAAALTAPDVPADVTGLRFTFENDEGFPQGFSVAPNVVFDARFDLRDGSGATDERDEPEDSAAAQRPTVYENEATAQSHGDVEGIPGGIDSELVDDQATVGVQVPEIGAEPGIDVSKRWVETGDKRTDVDVLDAQSGAVVSTRNEWRTGTRGIESLTLSDPATAPGADPAGPADTVFQAFDLLRIDPITLAQDPLLAWDDVTEVQLFVDGAWQQIAAPGGSWMTAEGGFAGYQLTEAETAGTTGVRLVYAPDDAARAASTDPTRPEVGSGLATTAVGQYRPTFLTWQLRNVVRDAAGLESPWVTAGQLFNADEAGTVWNTLRGDWTTPDGAGSDVDQDNIALIDQPPLVSVTKTATPATVTIPESADVDPANYPTVSFRLDARNDSTARASYVRVTDPIPCPAGDAAGCVSAADAWDDDPFDGASYDADRNPYERLDVLSLSFAYPASQVDPAQSLVTLWDRAEDGSLSTRTVSITEAQALTADQLATVVGVSAVFQGTDPAVDGGSIVAGQVLRIDVETRVRATERSSAATLVAPGTIDNDVLAQSYDPVLTPSGPASTPNDTARDTVELLGAVLDVTLAKTIAPDSLLESELETPVTVTLDATDGDATVATQQVTITDDDGAFWNGVRLADDPALAAVLPAGADQVRVDVLVDGDWVLGTFAAMASLPAGADPDAVTGIRAVFRNAAGEVFSRTAPPADWTARLAFDIRVLEERRDGMTPELPTELENTASAISERLDGFYAPADDEASAALDIDPGTHALDVVKSQPGTSHVVGIGASLPWTLRFTNTGTGYLTVDQVTDSLPEFLEWDYSDPRYETSDGGTLSTEVTAVADGSGKEITFTWPEGGRRMSPGEVFTITIDLALLPGLALDQFTENAFVVTTGEELDACTNTSGNGEGTIADLAEVECGTTNYVQPQPGGSISATKYVKGEIDGDLVDGQVNLNDPAVACPTDDDGYTRRPCAAYTAVGATDDWKLAILNSGTVGFPTVSVVDPLPRQGDRLLATGAARGSTFSPVLVAESLALNDLPAGATYQLDVTTSAAPCYGPGASSAWFGDPTCDSTAAWTAFADFTGAAADITGIRVVIDFTGTAAGTFAPGQRLGLHYQTVNTPASEARPDLAPIDVPDAGGIAWNQMGAVGTAADGREYAVAPVQAGVTLLHGDLGVQKVVEGASDLAPGAFAFVLTCTVAGVELALPDAGVIEVDEAGGLSGRLDGLPLGAACTVTERGDVGAYGETSRVGDGATIEITEPAADGGDVPEVQIVTIANVYVDPPIVTPPPTDADADADGSGVDPEAGLPTTGLEPTGVILLTGLGALLILLGAVLAESRRRRRDAR